MPFIGNIGPGELILVLIIALVIFGPGKLPEIGQAVGKGIREFRRAASDVTDATRVDAPPAATPPAPSVTTTPPPTTAPTPTPPAPAALPPATATDAREGDSGQPTA